MHANSLAAFDDIEEMRSERAEVIYGLLIRAGYPMTDRGVAIALGFSDMNMVRPRLTELRDNRWAQEVGSTECPVTHKNVRLMRALNPQERADLIASQRRRVLEIAARPTQQMALQFSA